MEFTNKIVEKFGADKLLHFLVAWMIVSIVAPFGGWISSGVMLIVIILAFFKETIFDGSYDAKDLLASAIGAAGANLYFIIC